MAHLQDTTTSLHNEIQNLKKALDASQKKADQYAHLIAKLSYELDNLRSSICHACRKKLVHADVLTPFPSVPAPSTALSTAPSTSAPLWRRILKGHRRQPHSPSTVASNVPAMLSPIQTPDVTPLPIPHELDAQPNLSTSETPNITIVSPPTDPVSQDRISISSEPESELPWSVVYNSQVKQALDLHIAHVFKFATPVYCAKISPDGQRVAVGLDDDGKTYINDVKSGSTIRVLVDLYVKDPLTIWCVQFSPDGQLLATAASDYRIRIWDIAKRRVRCMFKGHSDTIHGIAFSPDGRFLLSTSQDWTVRIWKLQDGSSRKLPATFFVSAAFDPEGRYIAASNSDYALEIWDARTQKLMGSCTGHTNYVWCVKFTPDGKGLLSGGTDETARYWDMSSLGIYQGPGSEGAIQGQKFPEILSFAGHTGRVRSISFFPENSQWVATGAEDRSVQLWDFRTGVRQFTLTGHTDPVRAVDFSQTEECLVTAGLDGRVAVWKYKIL